jgi:hypothetical protein
VSAILELVTRDRHREEVDRDLLRDAIQVFIIAFHHTIPYYTYHTIYSRVAHVMNVMTKIDICRYGYGYNKDLSN